MVTWVSFPDPSGAKYAQTLGIPAIMGGLPGAARPPNSGAHEGGQTPDKP